MSHNKQQFMLEKLEGCLEPESCQLHTRPYLDMWLIKPWDRRHKAEAEWCVPMPSSRMNDSLGKWMWHWRVVAVWNASHYRLTPTPSVLCSTDTHLYTWAESYSESKLSCPRTQHLCPPPWLHTRLLKLKSSPRTIRPPQIRKKSQGRQEQPKVLPYH